MRYVILKQFVPGNDRIWVEKLSAEDTSYVYNTLEEAEAKIEQLKLEDPNRNFKIAEKD